MKKIVINALMAVAALTLPAQLSAQLPAERIALNTPGESQNKILEPIRSGSNRTMKVFDGNSGLRQALASTVSPLTTPSAATAASLSSVNLIGSVISSETVAPGMYKISLSEGELTPLCTTADRCPVANRSGVAIDGKYYSAWQYNFFDIMLIDYIDVYDMETWERLEHNQLSNQHLFASDVSLDPVSGKVYGCYLNDNADGYVFGIGDYTTYTRTPVCSINSQWNGVAFAPDGTLYALDAAGDLLTVDLPTGSTTKVGSTGVVPYYLTSAVIDPKSGALIWSVFGEDQTGKIYSVDTATAEATLIAELPGKTEISGLVVIAPLAEDDAPAAVTDLAIDFPRGALTGTVSFKAPSTLFSGDAATGDLDYKVLANGVEAATGKTTFGATTEASVTVEKGGDYEFVVTVANSAGSSPAAKIEGFIGTGTPASPAPVLAVADGQMLLTWDPVTESVDNGYIDPATVTYTVTRFPGEEVVAEKTSLTSFTEPAPLPEELTSYYYTVVAHAGDASSAVSRSNTVALGSIVPPFNASFASSTGLDGYTILDVNADNITWVLKNGAANLYYNKSLDSDDWLISPPLKLVKGNTYRVAFSLYTTSNSYKERVEVKWGAAPTVEGMTGEILPTYEFASIKDIDFEEFITPEADGVYYIGFHGVSEKYQYGLNISRFSVDKGLSLTAPGVVTDIEVVPDYNGLNKATIKFNAPATDIAGNALSALTKVEVSRNGELVKTFDNPAVGAPLEFVDEPATSDTYTYTFTAYNESGAGKAESIVKFVGVNKPGIVTNLIATETSKNGEVTFTWDAPIVDADGYPLNPELLTYAVCEYTVDYKQILIKDGITETTFTYQAVGDDDEQQLMEWLVFAVTSKGSGSGVSTGVMAVGPDYTIPFKESVANGKLSYNFTSDQFNGGVWRPYTAETMPTVPSHDGDNGMFGMKGNGKDTSGSLATGKVKITGDKPGIIFFLYNIHEEGQDADLNEFNLYIRTTDAAQEKLARHIVMDTFDATGWYPVVVALDEYAGKTVYFRFEAVCRNYQYSFLDNIRVVNLTDLNLSVVDINAPATVTAGDQFDVNVTIDNPGLTAPAEYTVALYRNGEKVAELPGEAITTGRNLTYTFPQTLRTVDGEDHTYFAKIELTGDEDLTDNTSAPVDLQCAMPEYPAVTGLAANSVADGIELTWNEPDLTVTTPDAVTDDFEDGTPFARTYGKWTFLDLDGKGIGGLLGVPLPGITQQEPASFFVFDCDDDAYNTTFDAHSGTKYLASLFNYYYEQVDDWAISPRLFGGAQTISFFARSYHNRYQESIEILYSTTGTEPTDFQSIAKYEKISHEWTEFTADLPEGARYFAIRSFAAGAEMLLIDDVTYIPAAVSDGLELTGYNVYRDGKLLTAAPVTEAKHTDISPAEGSHRYHVTALYTAGESVPASVEIAYSSADIVTLGAISIISGNSEIIISGADGLPISIYTVDGRLTASATGTSCTAIPLQTGIYIVSVSDTVAKVTVR